MTDSRSSKHDNDAFQLMLDMKLVREILAFIVNCHEQSLDPAVGSLEQYSFFEIRQALASAAHQVVGDKQLSTGKFRSQVKRISPTRSMTLSIKYRSAITGMPSDIPHRIDLYMLDTAISKAYIIQLSLTLHGAQDVFDSSFVGFKDRYQRKDQSRVSPEAEKDYRHLWRGLRWLCANLLTWHRPGIILPEDLDDFSTFPLPSPRSP
jgi:hypothetical protein